MSCICLHDVRRQSTAITTKSVFECLLCEDFRSSELILCVQEKKACLNLVVNTYDLLLKYVI